MDMLTIIVILISLVFIDFVECNNCQQSYSKPMTRLSEIVNDIGVTKATILLQINECFIYDSITVDYFMTDNTK